jgi:hypothetical protein
MKRKKQKQNQVVKTLKTGSHGQHCISRPNCRRKQKKQLLFLEQCFLKTKTGVNREKKVVHWK